MRPANEAAVSASWDSENRLRAMSQLTERLKENRQERTGTIRTLADLERENEELRLKYSRALQLLSIYKSRAEQALADPDKGRLSPVSQPVPSVKTSPTSIPHNVESVTATEVQPPVNKRTLLMRYLELHDSETAEKAAASRATQDASISSKPKVNRMWRDRLMGLKSTSPKTEFRSPLPIPAPIVNEALDLAECMNSGEFKWMQLGDIAAKTVEEEPDRIEEISHLLSRRDDIRTHPKLPHVKSRTSSDRRFSYD